MTLLPARSTGRLSAKIRFQVARRPWIRWLLVAGLASGIGFATHSALARVDAARDRWADVVTVAIATVAHEPGDPLTYEWRALPLVAVPRDAYDADDSGGSHPMPSAATARQRIGPGEVIVATDLAVGDGPAASADPDEVVIAVSDPLVIAPPVGVAVSIYSDGLVLAERGHIVGVVDDVVYVAVVADDAPLVAAAAQLRQASIAFLP